MLKATTEITDQGTILNNRGGCQGSGGCYYVPLGSYTMNQFDVVPSFPPLTQAIVYRDVYYAPPNYQTLNRKVKSENLNYFYPSIQNAYCACQNCNYAVCSKCSVASNKCMN